MESINKCCHIILSFYFNELVTLIQLGHPDIPTGLLKCVYMTGLENHLHMNICLMLSQSGSWIPYPKCQISKES